MGGWGVLTETCPDRKLGLMGDVMEMDGPTFWESKELEPVEKTHTRQRSGPAPPPTVPWFRKDTEGSTGPTHWSSAGRGCRLWRTQMEKNHQHSIETKNQEPAARNQYWAVYWEFCQHPESLVPALVLVCEQLTLNQQKIWLKPRSRELVTQSQSQNQNPFGRLEPTWSAGTPPAPPGPRPWTPG